MASAHQILRTDFGHCADFPGGCFVPPCLTVSPSSAKIRAEHRCPARMGRENLFKGLLFCDCCGHPLTLSKKKLKDRVVDIYLCTHHNRCPDKCPQTHIIYHEVLYPYVLAQIRALARSMQCQKINSPVCLYSDIGELTPKILREVVWRIEITHLGKKQRVSTSVRNFWKLNTERS